jgi:hypothetical protein
MRIQPQRSFVAIDALLDKTTNGTHRAMLENFKAHMNTEISCDMEGIMATMSTHPVYHSYGGNTASDSATHVNGLEENRAFYQKIFDEKTSVLELDIERLSVDDWGIAGDGVIHIINPGKVLVSRGLDLDDQDAHYLVSTRLAWFLPYKDGLMCGEDTYTDVATATVTKLEPGDVVTPEEALA